MKLLSLGLHVEFMYSVFAGTHELLGKLFYLPFFAYSVKPRITQHLEACLVKFIA